MKSLTRTIIVLVVLSLVMGSFVLAQNAPEGKLSTYTISGSVGLNDVEMQGLPGIVVTDENGYYSATVDYGWSGRVKPIKKGYTFTPPWKSYTKITSNFSNQNYVPKIITFTISGEAGVGGVLMKDLPGIVVTDENGYYSATVNYGWSGTVTPTKEGYTFEPSNFRYIKVTHDQSNQNYAVKVITYTISGDVRVGGVVMKGLPGNPANARDGTYRAIVKYGWSSTVKPIKPGYIFEPANRQYTHLTASQTNQNYSPTKVGPAPILGRIGGRKILVIPATDVKVEVLAAMTRDLQVMSHIFDERFKEPRLTRGLFADYGDFFGRDSRATEAIYLQGYGVLFLMEVNFAFSPPLKPEEQKDEETAEQVDPTWQRAREQIFSPRTPRPGMPGFSGQGPGLVKIDQLKKEIIETLKHAANIRNLSPDEWIIITVIGQGRQSGEFYEEYEDYYRSAAPRSGTSTSRRSRRPSSRPSSSVGGGFGGGMMMGGMGVYYGDYREMAPPSATVLTIRAKKSDVDAFAKGELDFEQFQQKVEIFTY